MLVKQQSIKRILICLFCLCELHNRLIISCNEWQKSHTSVCKIFSLVFSIFWFFIAVVYPEHIKLLMTLSIFRSAFWRRRCSDFTAVFSTVCTHSAKTVNSRLLKITWAHRLWKKKMQQRKTASWRKMQQSFWRRCRKSSTDCTHISQQAVMQKRRQKQKSLIRVCFILLILFFKQICHLLTFSQIRVFSSVSRMICTQCSQ